MNNLALRIDGPLGLPKTNSHSSPCVSHPNLSPCELECLALRIATTDGVSATQARQQVARFQGAPSGPNVMAMRRRIRSLPLALAPSRPLH
jgi:hypothetical protein